MARAEDATSRQIWIELGGAIRSVMTTGRQMLSPRRSAHRRRRPDLIPAYRRSRPSSPPRYGWARRQDYVPAGRFRSGYSPPESAMAARQPPAHVHQQTTAATRFLCYYTRHLRPRLSRGVCSCRTRDSPTPMRATANSISSSIFRPARMSGLACSAGTVRPALSCGCPLCAVQLHDRMSTLQCQIRTDTLI